MTAEMRKTCTETVIDHARHPGNAGSMENADASTCIIGPRGDTMAMRLNRKFGYGWFVRV